MAIVLSGAARSESLFAALIALALLLAYRLLDRPSLKRALALGAAIELATLTRSEAWLLLALLVAPLVRLLPPGRRLGPACVAVLGWLVLAGPWVARNWITFDRPALSTNEGGLLAGANCAAAYYSPLIGTWPCFPDPPPSWGTNEAVISARFRHQAFDYASAHEGRVPAVVVVRMLRTWELYDPRGQAQLESHISDRNLRFQQVGVVTLYLLTILAAVGLVVLRRGGRPGAIALGASTAGGAGLGVDLRLEPLSGGCRRAPVPAGGRGCRVARGSLAVADLGRLSRYARLQ